MRRWRAAVALVLVNASLVRSSLASEPIPGTESPPPNRFRVTYDAPDGCPSKSAFVSHIVDRIGSDWQAPTRHENVGTIAAEVEQAVDGFEIHLICVSHNGSIARRNSAQADCAQAVEDMSVMAVACIQSTTEPPPMSWAAGLTTGIDWKMGVAAVSGGILFGIHWPTSPFSVSFTPTYSETLRRQGSTVSPWRVRLVGIRVEGCMFEPRWGSRVSFPICAAMAGGYLQTLVGETSTSRDSAAWATLGVSPHMRTFIGDFFLQWGPTLDVYLTRRDLPMGGGAVGYGGPPPVRVPILSGGLLVSVGYGAGHF